MAIHKYLGLENADGCHPPTVDEGQRRAPAEGASGEHQLNRQQLSRTWFDGIGEEIKGRERIIKQDIELK